MKDLVLLIGGKGTRLKSLTKKTPKCLIDIENKPFLYYLFKKFEKEKIQNIYLCSKYKLTLIKKFVQNYKSKKLNIRIFNDGKEFLGTGGSIIKVLKYLDDEFFIQNGDTFLDLNYESVFRKYKSHGKSMICYSNFKYNTLETPNLSTRKDKILNYDKSNFTNNNSIDAGLYIFQKKNFKEINLSTFDLSFLIKKLIKSNELRAYRIKKKFYEIGSLKGLNDFRSHISIYKNNIKFSK